VKINREYVRTRLVTGYDNLIVKQARTDIRKSSFFVRVVQKWNSRPDELKKSKNEEEFKRRIKIYKNEVGARPPVRGQM
jgi:hypothetical protein